MGTVAEIFRSSSLADVVQYDYSLAPLSTYRVGGAAEVFLEATSIDDLVAVAVIVAEHDLSTLVVGRGSNLLVADTGFAGVAVQLGEPFSAIEISPPGAGGSSATVRAGAAARLPVVARQTVAAGLTGFEWAVGVPGSIGGAIRMNAGGHGSAMAEAVVSATVVDLRAGVAADWSPEQLVFGYRSSAIQPHHLVLQVQLELEVSRDDVLTGERALSEIVRWRRDHQPGGQNAGSVFTNPDGDSAGRLIDAAGGKGLRVGSAEVSPKHANFIQADPEGSASDVLALMRDIVALVREHSGVTLHPETVLVGFDPTTVAEVIA